MTELTGYILKHDQAIQYVQKTQFKHKDIGRLKVK